MLTCMARTRIDVDDDLLTRVQARYGLRTKAEAVDFALRQLLVEPMPDEEAAAMAGSGWAGDLAEMRSALGVSGRARG